MTKENITGGLKGEKKTHRIKKINIAGINPILPIIAQNVRETSQPKTEISRMDLKHII